MPPPLAAELPEMVELEMERLPALLKAPPEFAVFPEMMELLTVTMPEL